MSQDGSMDVSARIISEEMLKL